MIFMAFVEGFKITDRAVILDAGIEIDQLMNWLMRWGLADRMTGGTL